MSTTKAPILLIYAMQNCTVLLNSKSIPEGVINLTPQAGNVRWLLTALLLHADSPVTFDELQRMLWTKKIQSSSDLNVDKTGGGNHKYPDLSSALSGLRSWMTKKSEINCHEMHDNCPLHTASKQIYQTKSVENLPSEHYLWLLNDIPLLCLKIYRNSHLVLTYGKSVFVDLDAIDTISRSEPDFLPEIHIREQSLDLLRSMVSTELFKDCSGPQIASYRKRYATKAISALNRILLPDWRQAGHQKSKYVVPETPISQRNIPTEFLFRFGNITIPVKNLFGTPKVPYSMDDIYIRLANNAVNIDAVPPFHMSNTYPIWMRESSTYLEEMYRKNGVWHSTFHNNLLPRINNIVIGGETQEDTRGGLYLEFGVTDFMTFMTTNRSLDIEDIPALSGGRPSNLRQSCVNLPYTINASLLSNPLSTHIVLISQSRQQNPVSQVIIQFRETEVASYPIYYLDSAAGYMNISHCDEHGMPNPFITAHREVVQELSEQAAEKLSPKNVKFIGAVINWQDLDINLYGYIRTGLSVEELLGPGFRRDPEGQLLSIPFDPDTVLKHISENRWEPVSAFAMCSVLLAFFPDQQVESAARSVPYIDAISFLENIP